MTFISILYPPAKIGIFWIRIFGENPVLPKIDAAARFETDSYRVKYYTSSESTQRELPKSEKISKIQQRDRELLKKIQNFDNISKNPYL